MIHVQHSIQISRPRDEVFDYLTSVENLSKWQANVTQARALDDGPIRVGSRFEQTLQMGPRKLHGLCSVTDFKTNERFAFSMKSSGPVDCDAHFDLQPVLGGTRLTLDGKAYLKGVWRLLQPMLAASLRRETKNELEALQRLLEAEVLVPAR